MRIGPKSFLWVTGGGLRKGLYKGGGIWIQKRTYSHQCNYKLLLQRKVDSRREREGGACAKSIRPHPKGDGGEREYILHNNRSIKIYI